MSDLFDLLGKKKLEAVQAEAEAARATARATAREAQREIDLNRRICKIVTESRPVLGEFRQKLWERHIAANFYYSSNTFRLEVPLKWTTGIISLQDYKLQIWIVRTHPVPNSPKFTAGPRNFSYEARPPRLPDEWSGPETLRSFLDRALDIFIVHFDDTGLQPRGYILAG